MEGYYQKLESLYSLYEDVKYAILLAENLNKNRSMYIAPINELRSALDHIFQSVNLAKDEVQCDYQLKEAKEHLGRAGCDALELLLGDMGTNAINKLQTYSTETLSAVFPKYFTEVRPKIAKIQELIAKYRKDKANHTGIVFQHTTSSDTTFFEYFQLIKDLQKINEEIDNNIPSLEDYTKRRKKERLFVALVGLASGVILTILSWLLGFWK